MNFYSFHKIVIENKRNSPSGEFRNWFLNELHHDIADELNQWTQENSENLPFSDLFGEGQTRKIVPFEVSPEATSIFSKLDRLGLSIDFKNGTVISNADSKFRPIRIGKFILQSDSQFKRSMFTPEEKQWASTQGNLLASLKEAQNVKDYAIIVSRNPIDIARMSNHDGWSSCHSPNKDYFKCAISDAKGAGAIAYVVNKEGLNELDLEEPEIFKDQDRRIHGIKPISRVRLRKFVHKDDDYDLAVPEDRTYGTNIPGFVDTIRNWALTGQQDKLRHERPSLNDFKLMGGSYQDTTGSELFNNFFGDDEDSGEAEYGGEDAWTNMADQYEEEINGIEKEYKGKLHICYYYAQIEEDEGRPYVDYSGGIYFEFPEDVITGSIPSHEQWDAYRRLKKDLEKWSKDNGIYAEDVEFEETDNGLAIRFELRDDDPVRGPDNLKTWIDGVLMDYEKQAGELRSSLYQALVKLGLVQYTKVNDMIAYPDDNPEFQNFEWNEGKNTVITALKEPIIIGTSVDLNTNKIYLNYFRDMVLKELAAWSQIVLKNKQAQKSLFPDFNVQHTAPFSGKFNIRPNVEFNILGTNLVMGLSIEFEAHHNDADADDALNFVQFLDHNYQQFENKIRLLYQNFYKTKMQNPVKTNLGT